MIQDRAFCSTLVFLFNIRFFQSLWRIEIKQMNHVPLALNPLNPAVRSSLIWQMLYLMGASNSFLSLSWLAPLQYLTQMVVKTHSHRAPHRTSTAGTFFFFRTLSLHNSRQRGPRAAVCARHHLAGRGYRDEYWWYEMPAAKPLPRNLTPSMLHHQTQPGIQAHNSLLLWGQ